MHWKINSSTVLLVVGFMNPLIAKKTTLHSFNLYILSCSSPQYLSTGVPLYKQEDNLLARWNVSDEESLVVRTYYQTGTYPTGNDIIDATATNLNNIPTTSTEEASAESLQPEGKHHKVLWYQFLALSYIMV